MNSFYQETSKYSNNSNKNTKLPSIKNVGSSRNNEPVWDSTSGNGIPDYESKNDRYCSISQIKKFNKLHKTKYKSSSGSSLIRNNELQKRNLHPSSSSFFSKAYTSSSQAANNLIDSSLQRQRLIQQHEQQHQNEVNQIHNDWNSQRMILETYLARKIKSRDLILMELRLLSNSYLDPSSAGDSNAYDDQDSHGVNNAIAAHASNFININQVEVINLLNVLRSQTLEIIEGIQEWKQHFTLLLPSIVPNLRHSQNFGIVSGLGIAGGGTENDNNSTYSAATGSSVFAIRSLNSMNHTVLPSFQYNNENYLMKISKDLDFLDVFEKKFQVFGFEFQYNPLAYPEGGSIITMFNQRFDHMNSDDKSTLITNTASDNDDGMAYGLSDLQNTNHNNNESNTTVTSISIHTGVVSNHNTSTTSRSSSRRSSTDSLRISIKNSPTANSSIKSPFFGKSPKNYFKSPSSFSPNLKHKSIDGIQYTRLQAAEKAIQWEFDLIMNPELATQAQLQHEYFLRHGYNPNGNNPLTKSSSFENGRENGQNSNEDDDYNNTVSKKSNRKKVKNSKVKYIATDKLSLALAGGSVSNITNASVLMNSNNNNNNNSSSATNTTGSNTGMNRRKSEYNSTVLVPVFTVTSTIQTKKEHLASVKEMHDGLKCVKTK